MNQSQDEARAARIQKYKEERRKQLTARTATLFSANVTDRRPRKAADRTAPVDQASHLKSSSELNLNTASTSVPIRTTRTSRLRAAAANQSDSSVSLRKSNRSSSEQSLFEDVKTKIPKSSKIIDRDKIKPAGKTSRRQSREKENIKNPSSTYNSAKEIGATKTKPKHSSNKNILEKDKSNFLSTSPKGKTIDVKTNSKLETNKNNPIDKEKKRNIVKNETINSPLYVNGEEIFDDIIDKNISSCLEKDQIEELFNDLVVEDVKSSKKIEIMINDKIHDDETVLKYSHNSCIIPAADKAIAIDNLIVEDSVVPKVVKEDVGGLLGAVCVRKVERFSELLSNLCSPREADILFEDVLVENGIGGEGKPVVRPSGTGDYQPKNN